MSHPQSSRTYRHQHLQALPSRPHSPVRSCCQVPFSCSPQAPLPYKHLPPGSSPLPRSPLQVLSPLRTTLGEHCSPMALMPTGTGPPRCHHVPQVPCFTALFPPDTLSPAVPLAPGTTAAWAAPSQCSRLGSAPQNPGFICCNPSAFHVFTPQCCGDVSPAPSLPSMHASPCLPPTLLAAGDAQQPVPCSSPDLL